jgi:peptidoglycan/xylan/chitin deacetylase (PgdA/CDA1 family)
MTVVPVLGYHSVSDERRDGTLRWSVSPRDFDEQMSLLRQRGHYALTVSEYADVLRRRAPLPARPVLVTFDDGFADVADVALPTLRRYGLPATAFVITSRVGTGHQSGPALGWGQLEDLRDAGIEIGSHSHTHRALDCLSPDELRAEIRTSRRILEDGLGAPLTSFAYPYGYHDRRVRGAVVAAGYTAACAVKNALSHGDDDVFAIARVLVERDTGAAGVEAVLAGRDRPLAWSGERLRTRGWRAYRRTRHGWAAMWGG